jgi:hypothetical protein
MPERLDERFEFVKGLVGEIDAGRGSHDVLPV